MPIGGESLAVAPYLMDPATVLLERFAKRSTHGVLTPPGFAGYGLGVLDSLRSSQLNISKTNWTPTGVCKQTSLRGLKHFQRFFLANFRLQIEKSLKFY